MRGSEYLSAITGNSEVIPSLKSASLERVVHNAHRIELRGESMRKKRSPTSDNADDKKQ
jgi:DNA replication protein DnaC